MSNKVEIVVGGAPKPAGGLASTALPKSVVRDSSITHVSVVSVGDARRTYVIKSLNGVQATDSTRIPDLID